MALSINLEEKRKIKMNEVFTSWNNSFNELPLSVKLLMCVALLNSVYRVCVYVIRCYKETCEGWQAICDLCEKEENRNESNSSL